MVNGLGGLNATFHFHDMNFYGFSISPQYSPLKRQIVYWLRPNSLNFCCIQFVPQAAPPRSDRREPEREARLMDDPRLHVDDHFHFHNLHSCQIMDELKDSKKAKISVTKVSVWLVCFFFFVTMFHLFRTSARVHLQWRSGELTGRPEDNAHWIKRVRRRGNLLAV